MTALREAAQQTLEAWQTATYGHPSHHKATLLAMTTLRAALAQQVEPTDPGHDVDVLREHVRHLERRVRELHAQQAEPVEPVATLTAQRDALLEALRKIGQYTGDGPTYSTPWQGIVADLGQTARAAIAAVEGEKT